MPAVPQKQEPKLGVVLTNPFPFGHLPWSTRANSIGFISFPLQVPDGAYADHRGHCQDVGRVFSSSDLGSRMRSLSLGLLAILEPADPFSEFFEKQWSAGTCAALRCPACRPSSHSNRRHIPPSTIASLLVPHHSTRVSSLTTLTVIRYLN